MYNNPSYQSPPESCPSPRGETQPGDLARSHGRTRTRAAASDFGAGGRAGPCWLRDSRRLQPSRGATHSGPGRGPAPSPPPRLPSAFLTRNPEAKKKQPSGRRVSIHSPVRLSVRPSVHRLHAHSTPQASACACPRARRHLRAPWPRQSPLGPPSPRRPCLGTHSRSMCTERSSSTSPKCLPRPLPRGWQRWAAGGAAWRAADWGTAEGLWPGHGVGPCDGVGLHHSVRPHHGVGPSHGVGPHYGVRLCHGVGPRHDVRPCHSVGPHCPVTAWPPYPKTPGNLGFPPCSPQNSHPGGEKHKESIWAAIGAPTSIRGQV